jgi:hypothetical protein
MEELKQIFDKYDGEMRAAQIALSELRVSLGGESNVPAFTRKAGRAEVRFYDCDGHYPAPVHNWREGIDLALSGGLLIERGSDKAEVLFRPRPDAHAPIFWRGHVRVEPKDAGEFLATIVAGVKAAFDADAQSTRSFVETLRDGLATAD